MLPPWVWPVVDLWAMCRRHNRETPPLPCSGGVGDQPAALMQAFSILDRGADEPVG